MLIPMRAAEQWAQLVGTLDPTWAEAQVAFVPEGAPGEAAERLREAGFRLVAADVEGGTDAFAFDWRGKWALVVGNEGNGLDPAFAPAERVTLPMPGGIESLNVSVAAAVLLYEAYRQRRGG